MTLSLCMWAEPMSMMDYEYDEYDEYYVILHGKRNLEEGILKVTNQLT